VIPHWRYRQLLRAYPSGARRDEVIDTLLMAGRATPTWREAANLLGHGLRARLGRPASRTVVAVALLTALTCGYFAAAVSTRLAWEAVPDYPAGARLAEITGTVFPGSAVAGDRDAGGLFHDPDGARDGLEPFGEDFTYAGYSFGPAGSYVAGGTVTRPGRPRTPPAGCCRPATTCWPNAAR
jgi:hypothetical protein